MLPSLCEALSAISAISAGHYYLMRIVVLLSHGNKRNKGNSLTRPMRSPFCYFCHFCGTISISCGKFFCPTEIKEIKEIQVSDVALGRPSASKLQGQELPKLKLAEISPANKKMSVGDGSVLLFVSPFWGDGNRPLGRFASRRRGSWGRRKGQVSLAPGRR